MTSRELNPVKGKLARGEIVTCMSVRLVASVEIVSLAKAAGLDSIYVDLEHSNLSVRDCGQICLAALEAGIPCFVRVPGHGHENIARVLDGGALGVIVPGVQSAAEARAIVEAAMYPPIGRRGVAGALPHLAYRAADPHATQVELNDAILVIVQIESKAALVASGDILAVAGVDMALVGANDLLSDFGLAGQFDHPRLEQAYDTIIAACERNGKHLGIGGLSSRPDLIARVVAKGGRFVSVGTDLSFLLQQARATVAATRSVLRRPG